MKCEYQGNLFLSPLRHQDQWAHPDYEAAPLADPHNLTTPPPEEDLLSPDGGGPVDPGAPSLTPDVMQIVQIDGRQGRGC